MSVICENCGSNNTDDAKTCSNCYQTISNSSTNNKKVKYYYIYPEKCSNCGAEITGQPEKCESCGSVIKAEKFRKENNFGYFDFKMFSKILFSLGLIFLVFVFIFKPFGNTQKVTQKDWRQSDNKIAAYVMMQQYVEKQLKSPSTAKFPTIANEEVKIMKMENQIYTMVSFVDSQNSFGAIIRTYFSGEIQQISEDKWEIITLEFVEN